MKYSEIDLMGIEFRS